MRKLDMEDCCSDQRVICVAVLFGADSGILLTIRSGGIEKAIVRYIMALPGKRHAVRRSTNTRIHNFAYIDKGTEWIRCACP